MIGDAIEITGMSKQYWKGPPRAKTLRDTVSRLWSSRGVGTRPADDQLFHALDDVSLNIHKGEIFGIVGTNGSGKSTLLKILARITDPTAGTALLRGRVCALLEVGAGLDPELDGIENIFLNGTILGMSHAEITRKLDQIIEFADIGDFMRTPIKHYSSGMFVRLGFSIAAHVEPDILLIDEVLAVGDARFQRKCLNRLKDVASHGRTVLFVSHDLAAVRRLCDRVVYLDKGRVRMIGHPDDVVRRFVERSGGRSTEVGRIVHAGVSLKGEFLDDQGRAVKSLFMAGSYNLSLDFQTEQIIHGSAVVVKIHDAEGALISQIGTVEEGLSPFPIHGATEVLIGLPDLRLFPGEYTLSCLLYRWGDHDPHLAAPDLLRFEVMPSIVNGAAWAYNQNHGVMRMASSATVRVRETAAFLK
ncbi:polysaccharide ABC transporter ATP-binding protein [Skermanella aerolata]|uniref:ABC transporter ATP-binding protein n=1 Tax=Skermanella aerolata TaxID=393310 RepID=UPI003D1D49E8